MAGNENKTIIEPKSYGYLNTVGINRQPALLFKRFSGHRRLVSPP